MHAAGASCEALCGVVPNFRLRDLVWYAIWYLQQHVGRHLFLMSEMFDRLWQKHGQ